MKKLLPLLLFFFAALHVQSQTKYQLLEEFSTAPCGFCPDGDIIAKQIIDTYPSVIWVTHHAGFGVDAMTVPQSSAIAADFTTFAPGACIDRGDYPIPVYTSPPFIAVSRQKWDSIVQAHLADPAIAEVVISNNYTPATRKMNCTVDVNFISTPAPGDFRINLFIVEDSVVGTGSGYDQTNYFNTSVGHPCYNLGDPIVGYVHHHVVRQVLTGNWGIAGNIPTAPLQGSSYSYSFSNIDILAGWKDQDVTLVGFVSYYHTDTHLRQVLNSIEVPLNTSAAGIANAGNKDGFSMYPNPAADVLHINMPVSGPDHSTMDIYDIQGQLVKSFTVVPGSATVSVNDFHAGVYFCRVKNNMTTGELQKLVIIH